MLNFLSSLRLFFSLCLALAAVFIYQTVFNRGVPVYGSPWFAALGLLTAVNIAVCSLRRVRTAPAHFTLLHAGLVIIILGAFASRFFRFEAQLPLHAGAAADTAYTDLASYKLPFSVELKDFRLEYYREPSGRITLVSGAKKQDFEAREGAVIKIPGRGEELKVLRLVRDFGLTGRNEVVEKSLYWNNPAVQLEITSGGKKKKLWFFSNFPGMHSSGLPFGVLYGIEHAEIRNFTSSVAVSRPSGPEVPAEISVNKPLKMDGYTLYQTSYDPADAGYTLLTVTMDRGLWIVYAGFTIFLTGVLLWLRK